MGKSAKTNPLKGAVYGLAAGAGASFLMDSYWKVVQNVAGERPEQKPKGDKPEQKDEPSTQVIADKASELVTGHEVPEEGKEAAGVAVHYVTGAAFGGLFGALAAVLPGLRLFGGLVYGSAIWPGRDRPARTRHIPGPGERPCERAPASPGCPPGVRLRHRPSYPAIAAYFAIITLNK